jgi:GAF domain-containing protein
VTSPRTSRAPSPLSSAERWLALLERITTDLAGSLSEEQIAQRVVGCLHDMLGATAAFFYVLGDDGREMRLIAHRGLSAAERAELAVLPQDGHLPLAAALNECRSQWVESCDELIARYPSVRACSSEWLRAFLVLPLVLDGRALGRMALGFDEGRTFDAAARRVLETVASQCAQALDRARLRALERAAWGQADAQRARLYGLFMHAPACIFVLYGPEHRIDFVNARFVELLG